MRILINAVSTKKHSGGAFQIAYNFIVKTKDHHNVEWIYVVSKDIDEILPASIKESGNYYVFPTQPDFLHTYKQVKKELKLLEKRTQPHVVYSISAPSYFTFDAPEVMRFTNPWVTHPNGYSWSVLSWMDKLKKKLYCWNQRRMMQKTKFFITQTELTKRGIIRVTGTQAKYVKVVQNVLPQIYSNMGSSSSNGKSEWVDIACVGAPVLHKNFEIIPQVLKELHLLGFDNIRFRVTIPHESACWEKIESEAIKLGMNERIITIGRCSQVELAQLYCNSHLCFLPTLLEVFSASTLEAMKFRLPIVATDFDFNREVLDDSCLYYTPKDPKSAAEQIAKYLREDTLQEQMKEKMDKRLELFSSYDRHFNEILSFLKDVAGIGIKNI